MALGKSKAAVNLTASARLRQIRNPNLHVDGDILFCTLCNIPLNHTRKSSIDDHLRRKKHLEAKRQLDLKDEKGE